MPCIVHRPNTVIVQVETSLVLVLLLISFQHLKCVKFIFSGSNVNSRWIVF